MVTMITDNSHRLIIRNILSNHLGDSNQMYSPGVKKKKKKKKKNKKAPPKGSLV